MDILGIGKKIEMTRHELGLTQVQLAELASVSYRPILQIESGRSVRLDTLLSICNALGLVLTLTDRGGMTLDRS